MSWRFNKSKCKARSRCGDGAPLYPPLRGSLRSGDMSPLRASRLNISPHRLRDQFNRKSLSTTIYPLSTVKRKGFRFFSVPPPATTRASSPHQLRAAQLPTTIYKLPSINYPLFSLKAERIPLLHFCAFRVFRGSSQS